MVLGNACTADASAFQSSPIDQRSRFDAHIENCRGCTDYLEQMRLTLRLAGKLAEESLVPEARDALLEAFRDWRNRAP